ncbi:MAG: 5-deoxy-glucuronate isomerase [Beijerinckiaceae bacterium]
MADIVRANANRTTPIATEGDATLSLIHFNVVKLDVGQSFSQRLERHESVLVPLSGTASVVVNGQLFAEVGGRSDIWSGLADSVYVPRAALVTITATKPCEIAIAGGITSFDGAPFRIGPDDVEMVDVGSPETHSRRRIFHILGQNGAGRTGNLLVSELYADEGCWSGYPPHKHDQDRDGETDHEELYHYRFDPPTGFGAQLCYNDNGSPEAFVTRHGDTFLLDRGYHPTVTSPGHRGYIFTILVGRTQRGLVQHFEEKHMHLTAKIPGLQAMRDKFK